MCLDYESSQRGEAGPKLRKRTEKLKKEGTHGHKVGDSGPL